MEKIKKYFSRIDWVWVIGIWLLINIPDCLHKTFSWEQNLGYILFVCIVIPLFSMFQCRVNKINDDHDALSCYKEIENKRDETINYLSTISYQDRLDLLKEVQLKKGK